MRKMLTFFSIFTSASTLICCALPALLVSLGLGASLAGLISSFPQLIWISQHKGLIFSLAGFCLAVAGYFQHRSKFEPCPLDPNLAKSCMKQRAISKIIYIISLVIYLTGAFFAFILPHLS